MSKVQQGSKSSHICEYCDKKFKYATHLNQHRRVHTGQRPFPCNLCDYFAATKSRLTLHVRSHLKEKPHKCPESGSGCNYTAASTTDVKNHHKFVHLREKRFQCIISNCGRKFGQKHHLMDHMTTHEENPDRPFKCHLCPYRGKTNGTLKKHKIQIHSDELNFKCPQEGCKYAAKTRGSLNMHLKQHDEKTLSCSHPNCEYKTNTKILLKTHMKIHSSDSVKKYKCRICDYSTRESGNLAVHVRVHTKETPYKCQIDGCSYQARDSGKLNRHTGAVHEKIRPFKCPVCPFTAAEKRNLKKHQKSRHPDLLQ